MEDTILISLIILLSIIIPVIRFVLRYNEYKNSNYYRTTQNSYGSVFWDSGKYGEYSLSQYLQPFESMGCKFLFNLYLPLENGKTTEFDIIMFHPKCLCVIESKNYSGWIFGHERQKMWTQTLPVGYGESHKEHFYNPIMQNATHIRSIRKLIDDRIPIYSVIAFSDKCTLKKVTVKSDNILVTYYSQLAKDLKIRLTAETIKSTISQDLIDETYRKLLPYSQVSDQIKWQHIIEKQNS